MHKFLDLLLYRHRRFKGRTYFKHHLPYVLGVNAVVSLLICVVYGLNEIEFFMLFIFFVFIDALLSIAAWCYYPDDL